MIPVHLRKWAAWAPGIEDVQAWHAWCAEPRELAAEGRPGGELPAGAAAAPLQLADPHHADRRLRVLRGGRARAAWAACSPRVTATSTNRSSCWSAWRSSNRSRPRASAIRCTTPRRASSRSRPGIGCASSSIAAETDTFGCGYLEALTFLERAPESPVLLVMADVPLAARLRGARRRACGVLRAGVAPRERRARKHDSTSESRPARTRPARARWPDALEFLRWLESPEPRLALGTGPRRFVWAKPPEPRERGACAVRRSEARPGPGRRVCGSSGIR